MKRPVLLNLTAASLAFGALGTAVSLQWAWNLQPCTMCILQRYVLLLLGLLALVRIRWPGRELASATRAVATLVAAVGVLASLRVQWAISVPSVSCGRDKVAAILNNLPWVDAWPSMFEATGVCGDQVPPVLGIPFHGWSALLVLVVLVLTWCPARRCV